MHKTGVGEFTVYSDGASRNNPGKAGAGVFIMRNGKPLERIAQHLGTTTNTIAEYTAAITGLERAAQLRVEYQTVRGPRASRQEDQRPLKSEERRPETAACQGQGTDCKDRQR